MEFNLSDTTIHRFPWAFVNKRSEPVLIKLLDEKKRHPLVDMYLAYEPRNSFSGLPPITDSACVQWVREMTSVGINLVALSFETGVAGHAALFPIDPETCEYLVAVSPPEQRIGIGTELTRCSIQLANELGFETMRLNVEAGNHIARHVYEKCGFQYLSHGLYGELDMSLDLQRHRGSANGTVGKIMNRNVITARQDMPCREVLRIFLQEDIATIPVVNEKTELTGILSETDLLVESNAHKSVGEVQTREVLSVQEGCPIAKVILLFHSRKLRCIPVLDRHGKLAGIVGRKEVLAHYAKGLLGGGRAPVLSPCQRHPGRGPVHR